MTITAEDIAHRIITANRYMTLATSGTDDVKQPGVWISPVAYAYDQDAIPAATANQRDIDQAGGPAEAVWLPLSGSQRLRLAHLPAVWPNLPAAAITSAAERPEPPPPFSPAGEETRSSDN